MVRLLKYISLFLVFQQGGLKTARASFRTRNYIEQVLKYITPTSVLHRLYMLKESIQGYIPLYLYVMLGIRNSSNLHLTKCNSLTTNKMVLESFITNSVVKVLPNLQGG